MQPDRTHGQGRRGHRFREGLCLAAAQAQGSSAAGWEQGWPLMPVGTHCCPKPTKLRAITLRGAQFLLWEAHLGARIRPGDVTALFALGGAQPGRRSPHHMHPAQPIHMQKGEFPQSQVLKTKCPLQRLPQRGQAQGWLRQLFGEHFSGSPVLSPRPALAAANGGCGEHRASQAVGAFAPTAPSLGPQDARSQPPSFLPLPAPEQSGIFIAGAGFLSGCSQPDPDPFPASIAAWRVVHRHGPPVLYSLLFAIEVVGVGWRARACCLVNSTVISGSLLWGRSQT